MYRVLLLRIWAVLQRPASCDHGNRNKGDYRTSANEAQIILRLTRLQLFYIAEYFYCVSAMFIKLSVAVALLRIAATRSFVKWGLWALMGACVIAALVFCVGIANICE
jgi:hypothetical protein